MILTSLIVSFLTLLEITPGTYGETICGNHCDNGVLSTIGSFLFGYAPCSGTCGVCAPSNTLVYYSGNPLNVCNKCYPGKKTCPDNLACRLSADRSYVCVRVQKTVTAPNTTILFEPRPGQCYLPRSAQIAKTTLTAPQPHNIVPTPAVPLLSARRVHETVTARHPQNIVGMLGRVPLYELLRLPKEFRLLDREMLSRGYCPVVSASQSQAARLQMKYEEAILHNMEKDSRFAVAVAREDPTQHS
ncbi:hypothetical protein B0H13DRAFT_2513209 [Mycena leptocephala]|nr:hypothetical protein B0H13DRAFT_2513209 [Mycena leptocephala]